MTAVCSLNGHSNPDNDHVTAPVSYADFERALSGFACAVGHNPPG
jgi:hypothetical protein